ncbi:MAG: 50S ribosomal protein L25 [Candidatus Pacebacteria bacterium]|nr:50S ribosomal protein L25 [Candidatus Paceibacterota bacterium]
MTTLTVTARDAQIKGSKIRNEGNIPAVVYGMGVEPMSVAISAIDFTKVFKTAGETSTITVSFDGKKIMALIHDVQHDPVSGSVLHVDLFAISEDRPVTVSVPLIFTGVSPAVKNNVGNLVKVLHELEIEVLPKHLPHDLTVDISVLDVANAQILVQDIKLPTSAKAILDGDEVVALIASQQEESEEATTAIDFSAIAVQKKGKKEEDAE